MSHAPPSEADAFLDAIFAQPDDDLPRLVYADWLEEHGQGHYAQFIRLQCEAARHRPWTPESNRLWVEIGRVWNRLYDEWWPATRDFWPGLTSSATQNECTLDAVHFRRGFLLPTVGLTGEQFVEYGTQWGWVPSEGCTLGWGNGYVAAVAASRSLSRIRDLTVLRTYGPAVTHLLTSPHLRNLRRLDVTGVYCFPGAVEALMAAPNLGGVQELRFCRSEHTLRSSYELMSRLQSRFPRVVPYR